MPRRSRRSARLYAAQSARPLSVGSAFRRVSDAATSSGSRTITIAQVAFGGDLAPEGQEQRDSWVFQHVRVTRVQRTERVASARRVARGRVVVLPPRNQQRWTVPTTSVVREDLVIQRRDRAQFEVPLGIALVPLHQVVARPGLETHRVEGPRECRGARAMHTDDENSHPKKLVRPTGAQSRPDRFDAATSRRGWCRLRFVRNRCTSVSLAEPHDPHYVHRHPRLQRVPPTRGRLRAIGPGTRGNGPRRRRGDHRRRRIDRRHAPHGARRLRPSPPHPLRPAAQEHGQGGGGALGHLRGSRALRDRDRRRPLYQAGPPPRHRRRPAHQRPRARVRAPTRRSPATTPCFEASRARCSIVWFATTPAPRLRDTQCGCKGFQLGPARILSLLGFYDRFIYDAEMLYLADQLGLSITPIDVTWDDIAGSSVRVGRDSLQMIRDLRSFSRTHYENPVVELPRLIDVARGRPGGSSVATSGARRRARRARLTARPAARRRARGTQHRHGAGRHVSHRRTLGTQWANV